MSMLQNMSLPPVNEDADNQSEENRGQKEITLRDAEPSSVVTVRGFNKIPRDIIKYDQYENGQNAKEHLKQLLKSQRNKVVECQNLRNQKFSLEKRIKRLEIQMQDLKGQKIKQVQNVKDQLEAKKKLYIDLKMELNEMKELAANLRDSLDKKTTQAANLNDDLARNFDSNHGLSEKVDQQKKQLDENFIIIKDLNQQILSHLKQVDLTAAKLQQQNLLFNKLDKSHNNLKKQLDQKQLQVEKLKEQIKSLQSKLIISESRAPQQINFQPPNTSNSNSYSVLYFLTKFQKKAFQQQNQEMEFLKQDLQCYKKRNILEDQQFEQNKFSSQQKQQKNKSKNVANVYKKQVILLERRIDKLNCKIDEHKQKYIKPEVQENVLNEAKIKQKEANSRQKQSSKPQKSRSSYKASKFLYHQQFSSENIHQNIPESKKKSQPQQ